VSYFPDMNVYGDSVALDVRAYQRSDGGIAILPHAAADPYTTVKVMPYIMNEVNTGTLRNYLYSQVESGLDRFHAASLYGLAMLREPILHELEQFSQKDDLSPRDAVYIALAYLHLGERDIAGRLYDSRVAPLLEHIAPFYRVNTGVDQDDILAATSAASLLATKLDKPQKDGLFQYMVSNETRDILIHVERLSYIEHEIARRTATEGSITYTLFGETFTRELKNGASHCLRIPAQNMAAFRLLTVTGDVGAVSHYKTPMTEMGTPDNDITVHRSYYRVNDNTSRTTFEQGDLVRVQIRVDYAAKALHGSYSVTDYLPAGLAHVSGSARIDHQYQAQWGGFSYAEADGQKVTFYDYNGLFDRINVYTYHARVVNPGTFIAEGPFVVNLTATEYYTVGDDVSIVIR